MHCGAEERSLPGADFVFGKSSEKVRKKFGKSLEKVWTAAVLQKCDPKPKLISPFCRQISTPFVTTFESISFWTNKKLKQKVEELIKNSNILDIPRAGQQPRTINISFDPKICGGDYSTINCQVSLLDDVPARACGWVGPRGHGPRASRDLKWEKRKKAGLGRG